MYAYKKRLPYSNSTLYGYAGNALHEVLTVRDRWNSDQIGGIAKLGVMAVAGRFTYDNFLHVPRAGDRLFVYLEPSRDTALKLNPNDRLIRLSNKV